MESEYNNVLGSERTVEIVFVQEMLRKYVTSGDSVLDVGGIPTSSEIMKQYRETISDLSVLYKVCDFRGGEYRGDFVCLEISENFNFVIFLSSLEHFPQCTESDVVYRDGYDVKGYLKALSILKPGGLILLTVPFGKHRWQNYHQNYNWDGILELSKGSTLLEGYTYQLYGEQVNGPHNGKWILQDPRKMEEVMYEDRAFGVGCFVFRKD